MKTHEEIKKGLEYLSIKCIVKKLDMWKEGIAYDYAEDAAADALAYIKKLEAERDAALRDIAIICETCLYNKPKYDGFKVRNECHNPEGCHYAAGLLCGWVWRGVCEENGGKDTNAPT